MSRHWKEKLDPTRHKDFMSSSDIGGVPTKPPNDNLIDASAYFVEVCAFRFEFVLLDQLRECLAYFSKRHHGPNRKPNDGLEHYWQLWLERLPKGINAKPKRKKVVMALKLALADFDSSPNQ